MRSATECFLYPAFPSAAHGKCGWSAADPSRCGAGLQRHIRVCMFNIAEIAVYAAELISQFLTNLFGGFPAAKYTPSVVFLQMTAKRKD